MPKHKLGGRGTKKLAVNIVRQANMERDAAVAVLRTIVKYHGHDEDCAYMLDEDSNRASEEEKSLCNCGIVAARIILAAPKDSI